MEVATDNLCAQSGDKRRIVIAGGGYAGTTCAVSLARKLKPTDEVEVLLVEPNPCQQALSELDLVAVGPPRPEFCELWLTNVFRGMPVTVCYNRIDHISTEDRTAILGPRGSAHQDVPYWRLVLATGAIAFVPPVPGLAEHAITMWSVSDAQKLQQRIEGQFHRAVTLADRAERVRALSFTVIGGGATGIEIVGTMAQMLPKRMRDVGLDASDLRVQLVEGRPEILYDLPPEQRIRAIARLEKLGVDIIAGSMVERVEADAVFLASGRRVDSSALVFCGGARPDPDAVSWGLEVDNTGRVVCDTTCKTTGHDDIYVVGDVAAFRNPKTGRTLPMLAQFAIREAEHTAGNIVRELRGEALVPFEPSMHGEFVSVGPSWGVGWMFKWNISGLPAIFMKRLTYVLYWFKVGGVKLAWSRTREMLAMQR
jgi:NADH dehydrogenase